MNVSFLYRHIDVEGGILIGSHLSSVKYCWSHISEIGASRNQKQKAGQEAREVEDRTHVDTVNPIGVGGLAETATQYSRRECRGVPDDGVRGVVRRERAMKACSTEEYSIYSFRHIIVEKRKATLTTSCYYYFATSEGRPLSHRQLFVVNMQPTAILTMARGKGKTIPIKVSMTRPCFFFRRLRHQNPFRYHHTT